MAESSPVSVSSPILILRVETSRMSDDALAEAIRDEFLTRWARSDAVDAVVDMGGVAYLSSTGFRPLLSLLREVRKRGGRLILCSLTEPVAEVFTLTRLITPGTPTPSVFEAQPNVVAAVASLVRTGLEDTL
jgi:anti-anti-sigma factor